MEDYEKDTAMLIDNFNHAIDGWLAALAHYSLQQLRAQPAPHSWPVGQVYMHLIADTTFFTRQIKLCAATSDHRIEVTSPAAETMFRNDGFPDQVIEGAPANAYLPQPSGKAQLTNQLPRLKEDMNNAAMLIAGSRCRGKTKHPGPGCFNAAQWLQFAEMHLRHHLRQKKRIDNYFFIHGY